MPKWAAIYLRVSTDRQTLENQRQALQRVAERRGWEVVAVYSDAGISGAKGRADRPGLDDMLKAAIKGGFDVVMAWSIDRDATSPREWGSLRSQKSSGSGLVRYSGSSGQWLRMPGDSRRLKATADTKRSPLVWLYGQRI